MRDRDNEPQICVDHLLARFGISLFDFRCELDLLLRSQKRNSLDLAQVSVQPNIAFIHDSNVSAGANPRYDATVGF